MIERWAAEDSQERRDRIKDADIRLEAWGRWSRSEAGMGRASSSNWFMALNGATQEEGQTGAKHVASCCPDEEAMQVDAIVARWKIHARWYWKVAKAEYQFPGTQDMKARHLRMSKAFYRQLLAELCGQLWTELDVLPRKAYKQGKLVEPRPARSLNARA